MLKNNVYFFIFTKGLFHEDNEPIKTLSKYRDAETLGFTKINKSGVIYCEDNHRLKFSKLFKCNRTYLYLGILWTES